jgi:hypothetical protein
LSKSLKGFAVSADVFNFEETFAVSVEAPLADSIKWDPRFEVAKYDERATLRAERRGIYRPTNADFAELGLAPYEVAVTPGNLLTTAGLGRIATLINAGTGNLVSSTTARVGAGNSNTAAAIGQTDLQASAGSSNRWFQTCTVTIPSNVWTFAATFATGDGNFAWEEWGIDIGTATVSSSNTVSAVLLNRKVASNGTKVAGQTWNATATITIS